MPASMPPPIRLLCLYCIKIRQNTTLPEFSTYVLNLNDVIIMVTEWNLMFIRPFPCKTINFQWVTIMMASVSLENFVGTPSIAWLCEWHKNHHNAYAFALQGRSRILKRGGRDSAPNVFFAFFEFHLATLIMTSEREKMQFSSNGNPAKMKNKSRIF